MLHQLIRLFRPDPLQHQAYALYARITEEARQPDLYEAWDVPDTLDGRFEMILLHLFLYLHRLKQETGTDTMPLQRAVLEAFFEDMDRSVREMGVGDTGVGKRVKAMANACYGRLHAYEQAFANDEALEFALRTNLYGTVGEPPEDVSAIVTYMHWRAEGLADLPLEHFTQTTTAPL